MNLQAFTNVDFEDYNDLILEDIDSFNVIIYEMVEDIELSAFIIQKYKERIDYADFGNIISSDDLMEVLSLMDENLIARIKGTQTFINGEFLDAKPSDVDAKIPFEKFDETPLDSILSPNKLEKAVRSPYKFDTDAANQIVKYLNFKLLNMLQLAAEKAKEEGSKFIKKKHFLPYCELWPYPLNRYC